MSCSPHRPSSEELLAKPSASGHIWFFSARALVLDTALTSSHVIYTTWRRLWSGWFHIQLFNSVATAVHHPEQLPFANSMYIFSLLGTSSSASALLLSTKEKKQNNPTQDNSSKQAQGNCKIKKMPLIYVYLCFFFVTLLEEDLKRHHRSTCRLVCSSLRRHMLWFSGAHHQGGEMFSQGAGTQGFLSSWGGVTF